MRVGKQALYVSTGTMVGKSNGYDYRRALYEIRRLQEKNLCDGIELMMLRFYYDKTEEVIAAVKSSGCRAEVIHCEKDIGSLFSRAGSLEAAGEREEAKALSDEAVRLFRFNCTVAEKLRIPRMVLHLWGGIESDGHIAYNVSKMETLKEIARHHGVRILCENIPSNHADPLSNWHELLPHLEGSGLVFDTRFGKLHEQIAAVLGDDVIYPHIEHVHISDFAGNYREFEALRPILHPGEGSIDFDAVADLLHSRGYSGTLTLESPVMIGDGLDIPKMEKTLSYLQSRFLGEASNND